MQRPANGATLARRTAVADLSRPLAACHQRHIEFSASVCCRQFQAAVRHCLASTSDLVASVALRFATAAEAAVLTGGARCVTDRKSTTHSLSFCCLCKPRARRRSNEPQTHKACRLARILASAILSLPPARTLLHWLLRFPAKFNSEAFVDLCLHHADWKQMMTVNKNCDHGWPYNYSTI